jgi:two-component system sensor histidine kinase TctE
MTSGPSNVLSIRRRLLAFLIGSTLLVMILAALATWPVASHLSNSAYDRGLLDPAFDIADNVRLDVAGAHVDLPAKALEALTYDQVDTVIFQVRSVDDAIIDGVSDLPPPPAFDDEQHVFFDAIYRGEAMRVAALRSPSGTVVQVGETLHKRNRLTAGILIAEVVAMAVVALGSFALSWFGVAWGLLPLERVRRDLRARSPNDLRPLAGAPSPVEIAPVIEAFNRLLDHLRDANTLQRRFVANAAHQLRTPLAGLQLHLELLCRRPLSPDVLAELERMHSATVRASRLATQILALAHAEGSPQRGREHRPVDLLRVASAAADGWAMRAFDLQIDLGFALEPALVPGDPLLLGELLDNLVDNALRYTPQGGQVTVFTGQRQGLAYLSVVDSGPGIPAAERSKVLERFYRVQGTPGEGSGLGLAIVREVAERHGAKLDIAAGNGNSGTAVSISFPQQDGKLAHGQVTDATQRDRHDDPEMNAARRSP